MQTILDTMGKMAIQFIENEIIKHGPEIEAAIIEGVEGLIHMFQAYLAGKTEDKK